LEGVLLGPRWQQAESVAQRLGGAAEVSAHLKVRPLKPERERVRRRLIREVGRALRDGRLPPLPRECRARPRPPKQPSEEERECQAACRMPHAPGGPRLDVCSRPQKELGAL